MKKLICLGAMVLMMGGAFACSKGASVAQSSEEKKLAALAEDPPMGYASFRQHLIEHIPGALEQTSCQCCNKPLKQCYEETLVGKRPGCPDT